MIQLLDATSIDIARKIRAVFQVSYAVEADLLGATNFPPLQRTLVNFVQSKSTFYGYFKNESLAAVIEIKNSEEFTHIQSLVVDPYYFRQGLGAALLTHTLQTYQNTNFCVETGLKNVPAIALYTKFGFIETNQWDTDHGVRKVRFKKH